MKFRIVLAGVLGGLVLFGWGAVSHMVLRLGDAGYRPAPPAPADQALLDGIRTTLPESGLYGFPGMDPAKMGDPKEMEAWTERTKSEPHGIVIVRREPYAGMSGQFVREILTDVGVALLAAFVLCCATACRAKYFGRVGFVGLLGLIAGFREVQLWNWYEFPSIYAGAQVLDGVLGFLAMGLVIAALVKRPEASPAAS